MYKMESNLKEDIWDYVFNVQMFVFFFFYLK